MSHKSGFINIIGRPNVGKSTLMNALIGQKLSIITSKAQTTRHRILGILNGEDFQMIFSDTPGIIRPEYGLQKAMMSFVKESFNDADIIMPVVDVRRNAEINAETFSKLKKSKVPVLLILNKTDLSGEKEILPQINAWKEQLQKLLPDEIPFEIFPVSALKEHNLEDLFQVVLKYLPESPPFFPKDQITDKPEKFFTAEIIREKILVQYREEIPYSVEVQIAAFEEEEKLIRIHAEIVVNKKSHKPILIGKKGSAMKKLGTAARLDIEEFLGKKVYLELYVKIRENWKDNPMFLKGFGY